jgi:hypothetical protein
VKKVACIVGIILVSVAVGLPANAQDQSKRALAEEMLNLMNMRQTLDQTTAMIKQFFVAQIRRANPAPADPAAQAKLTSDLEKIMDMVKQEASWDKMKGDYISIYSEAFTEPELKDIVAFYKTPSGQALIKKQPQVMKRSLELSQKMMGRLLPKIKAMVDEMKKDVAPKSSPKPQGK